MDFEMWEMEMLSDPFLRTAILNDLADFDAADWLNDNPKFGV